MHKDTILRYRPGGAVQTPFRVGEITVQLLGILPEHGPEGLP